MFLISRHRLALSSLALAALTACGGGSSDPATPAATEAATATETAALTCIQPAYPSTGYSQVFKGCDAANVATYYAKDECVRDNVSGLIWQGQTAAGTTIRSNDEYKTNLDSTTELQKRYYTTPQFSVPTDEEVNSKGNSIGFKNAINASKLCGSGAWRLPTKDELLGIVKINKTLPSIDTDWFPNTPRNGFYWSASPYEGYAYFAWGVSFNYGNANYDSRVNRSDNKLVRLVR
ncbi:MAG: DUF1566 domain-containing protein [Burkholderiaceae bacterium]